MTFHLSWSKNQPSHPDLRRPHHTPVCLQTPYSLLQPLCSSSQRPCTETQQVGACLASTVVNSVTSTLRGAGLHDESVGCAGHSLAILLFSSALAPPSLESRCRQAPSHFIAHSLTPGPLLPCPPPLTPGPLLPCLPPGSTFLLDSPPHPVIFLICLLCFPACPLCRLCESKVLFFLFSVSILFLTYH